MSTLSLQHIQKRFGGTTVIKDLSLEIADREFVVFVGPSGCGKSTLVRMIAGLEDITEGTLLIDGQRMNEIGAADRGLAMVFQSYALYPHMSVRQNMSFALRLAKVPRAERDRKVEDAARILHLEGYLDRKPGQLSGGQRQRVAIGRAIVRHPKVFLFDEPLSNLDAALRGQMRIELARLHETLEATMIYVTHDQVEAMTLADRIVVLREGRIEQVGTPLEIYHHPINLFVAEFIGSPPMNRLAGRVSALEDGGIRINIPGAAPLWMTVEPGTTQPGDAVTLGIRAEDLRPAEDSRPGEDLRLGKDSRLAKESRPVEDSPPGARGALTGTVSVIERLGALSLIYVDLDQGGSMVAQSGGVDEIRPHQKIRLAIDSARCHVFDAAGRTLPRTRPRGTPSAGAVPS